VVTSFLEGKTCHFLNFSLQEAKEQVIAETADVLHIPHYAAEALLKSADWSCEVLLGDKCYKTFFSISVRQSMLCHTKFLQGSLILLRLSEALLANIRLG
jgi:hypothetical protein